MYMCEDKDEKPVEEVDEKPVIVECDFCHKSCNTVETPVTKNWQETGWNVCIDCLEDETGLVKILLEELHKRTSIEYDLCINYNQLKKHIANVLTEIIKQFTEAIDIANTANVNASTLIDIRLHRLRGYTNACKAIIETL